MEALGWVVSCFCGYVFESDEETPVCPQCGQDPTLWPADGDSDSGQ